MENLQKIVHKAFQTQDADTAYDITEKAVRELVKRGHDRKEIVSVLNIFYEQYLTEGKDEIAEYIIGIMDALSGWGNPKYFI